MDDDYNIVLEKIKNREELELLSMEEASANLSNYGKGFFSYILESNKNARISTYNILKKTEEFRKLSQPTIRNNIKELAENK